MNVQVFKRWSYKFSLTNSQLPDENEGRNDGKRIISLGGRFSSFKAAEVYNLTGESAKNLPDLPEKLDCHCSLRSDAIVYCIGGKSDIEGWQITNKIWQLDLNEENLKWKEIAQMNVGRCLMGATTYLDTMVVAGGSGPDVAGSLSSAEMYVKDSNSWTTIASLNQRREGHALVTCNGFLFALGGWDSGDTYFSSMERLSALDKSWEYVEPMQTPRFWFVAVNCRGIIYAIGGQSNYDDKTSLKSVEKYDPAQKKWTYVCDMNKRRDSHAACILVDKIYVIGGRNKDEEIVKEIECYDPDSDTWKIVGEISDKLMGHSLIVI